jgi:hypothetical protein
MAENSIYQRIVGIETNFQQDHLGSLEEGLGKYVQPFKFLFSRAYWLLTRLTLIPLLPMELAYRIRLGLTTVINFFSDGQYEDREYLAKLQLEYTAAEPDIDEQFNWQGLSQLQNIVNALSDFIAPKENDTVLWEFISAVTLPLRVILALILVPASIIAIFSEQLLRRLLTPVAYLLRLFNLPAKFLFLLVLNFPRYPSSILLVAAAIGFTIATFGIAPIMLAIAAVIGMLSSMIIFEKKLLFLDNPYIKWGLIVLTFIAAAASVVFSAGAAIPAIAAVLPFTLPQIVLPSAIVFKALIAAGVGFATTSISTIIIPGGIRLLIKLKDCCGLGGSESDSEEESGSSSDSPNQTQINKNQPPLPSTSATTHQEQEQWTSLATSSMRQRRPPSTPVLEEDITPNTPKI